MGEIFLNEKPLKLTTNSRQKLFKYVVFKHSWDNQEKQTHRVLSKLDENNVSG